MDIVTPSTDCIVELLQDLRTISMTVPCSDDYQRAQWWNAAGELVRALTSLCQQRTWVCLFASDFCSVRPDISMADAVPWVQARLGVKGVLPL